MPSVSKAQQRASALALEARKGNVNPRNLQGAALSMFQSMKFNDLKEFAQTRRKGLPNRVKRKRKESIKS